jgi:hypothetical protein
MDFFLHCYLSILSVADEGYSRNMLWALNLISTFLLISHIPYKMYDIGVKQKKNKMTDSAAYSIIQLSNIFSEFAELILNLKFEMSVL